MNILQTYIQAHFGIKEEKLHKIEELFKPVSLNKGDLYLKEGSYCKKMSFIKSGYLRIFRIVEGKEITQWISGKDYFVTEIASLMFGVPSRWEIVALTDCELFTIHNENYNK